MQFNLRMKSLKNFNFKAVGRKNQWKLKCTIINLICVIRWIFDMKIRKSLRLNVMPKKKWIRKNHFMWIALLKKYIYIGGWWTFFIFPCIFLVFFLYFSPNPRRDVLYIISRKIVYVFWILFWIFDHFYSIYSLC